MEYTVILPAYNEEKRIASALERIRKHTQNILVIDDGSTDKTSHVAELAGAQVIRLERNLGKGAAVIAGLAAAKTEAVVLIDADNQFSPDEIPLLLKALAGCDLVLGNRFATPASSKEKHPSNFPFYRFWANRIIHCIVHLRSEVPDPLTGFRALRKSKFTGLKQKGFNTDLEMVFYAMKKGYTVSSVPVSISYPENSESKFSNPLSFTAIYEYLKLFFYALGNVF